jgi:hypothetical protein
MKSDQLQTSCSRERRAAAGGMGLSESNLPSTDKLMDLVMLVLTGGRERTTEEYHELLVSRGFKLHRVIPTASEYAIIEAIPT